MHSSPTTDSRSRRVSSELNEQPMASSNKSVQLDVPSTGASDSKASDSKASDSKASDSKALDMKGLSVKKGSKIGHWRKDQGGTVTYKNRNVSELMLSIQLGIQYSLFEREKEAPRDILMVDFESRFVIDFPHGGGTTPAHNYSDFRFKTYAHMAFRHFRAIFKIETLDFVASLCNEHMTEVANPGASGSVFYISSDDKFIIKTVQKKECQFLKPLLAGYYMNLRQNPETLLPKFYGLFCYRSSGKNIRLLAMNNLLPSKVRFHEKFDLKGSTYKRKASQKERTKSSPTLKDLDFIEHPIYKDGIFLESNVYQKLIDVMQRDCKVLESFQIMDYSLLLAIHNVSQAKRESHAQNAAEQPSAGALAASHGAGDTGEVEAANKRTTSHLSGQMGPDPVELHTFSAQNSKGDELTLYMGIIDILQQYRLAKKMEHTWKSMLTDGETVSVINPSSYSNRFQKFVFETVFRQLTPVSTVDPVASGRGQKFRRVAEAVKQAARSKGFNRQRTSTMPPETVGSPMTAPTLRLELGQLTAPDSKVPLTSTVSLNTPVFSTSFPIAKPTTASADPSTPEQTKSPADGSLPLPTMTATAATTATTGPTPAATAAAAGVDLIPVEDAVNEESQLTHL